MLSLSTILILVIAMCGVVLFASFISTIFSKPESQIEKSSHDRAITEEKAHETIPPIVSAYK